MSQIKQENIDVFISCCPERSVHFLLIGIFRTQMIDKQNTFYWDLCQVLRQYKAGLRSSSQWPRFVASLFFQYSCVTYVLHFSTTIIKYSIDLYIMYLNCFSLNILIFTLFVVPRVLQDRTSNLPLYFLHWS